MSTKIDFKEQARALINQILRDPGKPVNKELARSAVEIALRDAYIRGAQDATGASAPPVSQHKPASQGASTQCAHKWEESFLDGRSVDVRCTECGVFRRDVQGVCDHFFVKVGGEEVCVACRKPRRSGKSG